MTEENISPEENEEIEEPVINTNPKLRWYVVQAFSGYEGRVQKTLVEHIEIQGLKYLFQILSNRIYIPQLGACGDHHIIAVSVDDWF